MRINGIRRVLYSIAKTLMLLTKEKQGKELDKEPLGKPPEKCSGSYLNKSLLRYVS